jgi:hypothetical protein
LAYVFFYPWIPAFAGMTMEKDRVNTCDP